MNYGNTPLHEASMYGLSRCVRVLVKYWDVNAKNNNGWTALHYAENSECIKILLENGADVNAVNKKGSTPLHLAAEKEQRERIKLLIQNGADSDIENVKGKTSYDLLIDSMKIFVDKMIVDREISQID